MGYYAMPWCPYTLACMPRILCCYCVQGRAVVLCDGGRFALSEISLPVARLCDSAPLTPPHCDRVRAQCLSQPLERGGAIVFFSRRGRVKCAKSARDLAVA